VMNGRVQDVGGVTMLGVPDPRHSGINTGLQQVGDKSPAELGDELHDVACASDVDLLLVHEPDSAKRTVEDGCAKLVLDGHLHREDVRLNTSGTLQITGDSAGGVKHGELTVDKPLEPAVLYAIQLDPYTHEPTFYQTITVNLDGSVEIGHPVYVLDLPRTDLAYSRNHDQ
jgi:hypothetical protein